MADNDPSTNAKSSGPAVVLFAAVGLVLLSGAVALGWKLSRVKNEMTPIVSASITPAPAAPPENTAISDVERQEVLKRIDLMPNITPEDKDKLYMSVERARQMGKILTIPFPSGHVAVSPTSNERVGDVVKRILWNKA